MDINQVIQVVKEASEIMKLDFSIYEKDSISNLVTTADTSVQDFLCQNLSKLLPDCGFLCEENHFVLLNKEYIWVIDPIDGTTNFTRGLNQSAISVALMHNGQIELGVVFNPFTNDLYYAQKGKGAFNNGTPIHTSSMRFEEGILCTAMSLYKKEFAPICQKIINDSYSKCNDFRRFGTCALELCYLAKGSCDLYFEIRLFAWDFAAASLILTEAGGVLGTLNSGAINFDEKPMPLIAANNLENFNELNAIVHKHMQKVPY